MTLKEFLKKHPVSCTAVAAPTNPNMTEDDEHPMVHWYVTLEVERRFMRLYYSCGVGLVDKRNIPNENDKRVWVKECVHGVEVWMGQKIRVNRGGKTYLRDLSQCGFRHWDVYDPKETGLPSFSTGEVQPSRKHRPHVPTASDILDCLASDTQGVDNARNFEDWADEYGYSTDSRSAERTYQICTQQAKELRQLLGHEAYTLLLNEVECE